MLQLPQAPARACKPYWLSLAPFLLSGKSASVPAVSLTLRHGGLAKNTFSLVPPLEKVMTLEYYLIPQVFISLSIKKGSYGQAWQGMPVIPAFKLRQEGHFEFQNSRGHTHNFFK